ncbi:hypothetical protein LOTGIDRAFT_89152, partial [Lottia gigantea]
TTLSSTVAAVRALKDRKGSTVPAIRKYVLSHSRIPPKRVNGLLRRALSKGLRTGALVRPKGSRAKGAKGRFKVGR